MSDMNRVERDVEVVNRAGMHARPAAEFVKVAGRFRSEITVAKDGLAVNGKSISPVPIQLGPANSGYVTGSVELKPVSPEKRCFVTACTSATEP